MYENILVPTDGTELAEQAVGHAVELAKRFGAKLTGVTVTPPLWAMALDGVVITDTQENYDKWVRKVSEQRLGVIRQAAAAAGVSCEVVQVEEDRPYAGIIKVANEKGCDLIVMASHGRRGVSALLLGSETQRVLTHSKIPVLVYR